MRSKRTMIVATIAAVLLGTRIECSMSQTASEHAPDEKVLSEYCGTYRWEPGGFLYLQLWNEFTGTNQLVAFDESGEVRTLYPTDRDRFFAGPGAAISTAIESRIDFQRDRSGRIRSLTWRRDGAAPRLARRVEFEKSEDVRFTNGDIHLAATLISPNTRGQHPAIILVHGSGAEDREYMLPSARFLIRHGITVLGYDKRGVGGSTGDWHTASFEDLAGDVVAAFEYLKKRNDIDAAQIGLLGVSQAGWIMPIAAVRAPDIAFLISVSGAAIVPAETTFDEARREMAVAGRRPEVIQQIVDLMRLEYRFAQTGEGWDEYSAARQQLATRFGGTPPPNFPSTREDPLWRTMRAFYFYDPAPTLRRLRTPTLAIFGELDNNVLADKNKAAWEAALKVGVNRDYTLTILPKANHMMLEAKVGSNTEMASLQRFVLAYSTTVRDWLATRIRGFRSSR